MKFTQKIRNFRNRVRLRLDTHLSQAAARAQQELNSLEYKEGDGSPANGSNKDAPHGQFGEGETG